MKEKEREYIITFIIKQGFSAGGQGRVYSYLKELLNKYKGKIEGLRFLGERKFAYPIKKQQMGMYVFAECKMPNTQVRFFRRDLELTGDIILRFLILRKEEGLKVLNIYDIPEYKEEGRSNKDGAIS